MREAPVTTSLRISGIRIVVPAAAIIGACLAACVQPPASPSHDVIPLPRSAEISWADTFHLSDGVRITFDQGDLQGERIARQLAALIGNSEETTPEVVGVQTPTAGSIHLTRQGVAAALGDEGYSLDITAEGVSVAAAEPAGLFYGVQTLRQLLPPLVEYQAAYPNPLFLPTGRVEDHPRFEWRGMMLDVARHFLPPDDVKWFIDLMALYKLNRLHLHLSDDQGWRIQIPGWENLTEHGGSTEVGGRPAGYYTTEDYRDLVQYAADRFITVVPEIDVPGHTNAALASYPELNCDGVAPDLYTGTEVGFSTLCPEREITYQFLDDVIREISTNTQGPYFHVGGDEVKLLTEEEYVEFIERVQGIVESHGKRLVGWDEVASADLSASSTVQLWRPFWPGGNSEEPSQPESEDAAALAEGLERALDAGVKVILSPADRLYLDMKYDEGTILGLTWAGLASLRTSYDWSVTDVFASVPESSILGVEAPLWSETVRTVRDFEYMAFPRLAGVAEIGWSEGSARSWDEYRLRLGAQAPRWSALGVNFQRSPGIPWLEGPFKN